MVYVCGIYMYIRRIIIITMRACARGKVIIRIVVIVVVVVVVVVIVVVSRKIAISGGLGT